MSQGRGIATDSLLNIIQVIQMGRKSGILTVERGEGSTLETGQITFVQGHITQVRNNLLNSQQALDRLRTWQACRFTFLPLLQNNVTGSLPSVSLPPPVPSAPPPQGRATTQPLTYSNSYLPVPANSTSPATDPWGNAYNAPAQPYHTVSLEQALRNIEQRGLTRAHRRLFLLINGQRTTTELIRLMSKQADEVLHLLDDLAYIGVIKL
jgi:hypothetical protein